MFTGLVDAIGTISKIERQGDAIRAEISAPYLAAHIAIGASISCDGVCLTVIDRAEDGNACRIDFDISPETTKRTNLDEWREGQALNLERAMKIGDEIGGHIVSGHVDGIAVLSALTRLDDNIEMSFDAPEALAPFIATKGSVCLNGTSLTVNWVEGTRFGVNLIPHTLEVTTWKSAQEGDRVNIEIDMLARYVARLREFDR